MNAEEIPEPPAKLHDREIWLAWHYEEREDSDGEPYQTKVPDNPHREPRSGTGDSTEPAKRTTFEDITAYAADYADEIDGIGFAFPEDALLCGVDLDDVLDTESGEVRAWASDVIERLDSYTERSPSGSGYHVIVFGIKPGDRCKRKRDDGETEIECYDEGRFFTYTGDHVEDTPTSVNQRNDELSDLYYEYLEERPDGDLDEYTGSDGDTESTELGAPDLELTDEEVLEKARNAENGAKFYYLADGGDSMHDGDTSAADQAFCNLLAFWTGGDRQQMDRLFRNSGRMRSKWDEDRGTQTYGELTIDTALKNRTEFYEPNGGDASSSVNESETETIAGDGGTVTANVQGESDANTDTDSENTQWPSVRANYAAREGEDSKVATNDAAELVDTDFNFLTHEESEELFVYDSDAGIYQRHGTHRVREYLQKSERLGTTFSPGRADSIIETVSYLHYTPEEDFGAPEGYVCAEEQVLQINGSSVTPTDHSPEFGFLSALGTGHDPNADCPQFMAFLDEVLTTEQAKLKLQEYAGYCLMHWGLPYHKALFLVGPTASGKSTFLDTISAMLGEETVSHLSPQQLTGERFAPAEIYGKWANIRNDIPETLIENTGTFKEIVAGDPLKAERKYKNPFYFNPNTKHLFSANQLPDPETNDEAFYRRILLCPFPDTIPVEERDPDLDEKLQAELPGVLNWALEGLERLQEQRGFTGDRSPGETQETWERWGHTIDRFKDECLEEAPGTNLPTKTAYTTFVQYCHEYNVPSTTQHKMTRRLGEEHNIENGRAYIDDVQKRCLKDVQLSGIGQALRDNAETDE